MLHLCVMYLALQDNNKQVHYVCANILLTYLFLYNEVYLIHVKDRDPFMEHVERRCSSYLVKKVWSFIDPERVYGDYQVTLITSRTATKVLYRSSLPPIPIPPNNKFKEVLSQRFHLKYLIGIRVFINSPDLLAFP